ncbi:MAG: DUF1311 domain-containing protein [Burkholderiales bacterium]|nr:DUF1311 domain-containing protein [Burkholderiales bacterium]
MKYWEQALIAFSLCVAPLLHAAQPADPCVAAMTTIDINECMSLKFTATERELDRVYQELIKRIDDNDPKQVDRGTVQRRLTEAQRSWVAFRRQDCEGMYKLFEGGSIRNARFHGCMIERTERRIAELKGWDQP